MRLDKNYCRLYLHRIIFIVIYAFTSYNVAHFYFCDDACRLVSLSDYVALPRPDDMKAHNHNWAVSRQSNFKIFLCLKRFFNVHYLMLSKVGQLNHTFSAFWLWSSVVSVLISVTTDMSPTGDLIVTSIFVGEMSSWACSGTLTCCTSLALFWSQLTLRGNYFVCVFGVRVWIRAWVQGSGFGARFRVRVWCQVCGVNFFQIQ